MKFVFVDTSAWYALADSSDPNFSSASDFLRKNTFPLITTSYIFSETVTLLRYRMGHQQAADFGERLFSSRSILMHRPLEEDELLAWEFFKKHSDKQYSFTDCLSFILMRKFKLREAFSFDRHFEQAGFKTITGKS